MILSSFKQKSQEAFSLIKSALLFPPKKKKKTNNNNNNNIELFSIEN